MQSHCIEQGTDLPVGAFLRPLTPHADARGSLTEVHRAEWSDTAVVQWNVTRNEAGALRGMHLHLHYDEIYVLPRGAAEIVLYDLRPDSRTLDRCFALDLRAVAPTSLLVPAGVLHGLAFVVPSLLLVGRTREHDGEDDWRCRWDDPDLRATWRPERPLLSDADSGAGSLAELRRMLAAH